jgi:hypothetical protein
MRSIKQGSTEQSVLLRFLDDPDGTPETSVDNTTAGLSLWYRRDGGLNVTFAAASLAALDSAHVDGGIKHVSDGYYRVDVPDAAFAAGAAGVMIGAAATSMVAVGCYVPLVAFDPQDNRIGLTGIPTAAPGATGGLALHDTADAIKQKTDVALPSAAMGVTGGLASHVVTSGTATIVTQLKTDLQDGGRLDLIFDEIATGVDGLSTAIDGIEATADVTITPVVSTVSTGEVKAKNLTAYQFAAFGPFTFTIVDQTATAVNLAGKSITFVAYDPATGKNKWQIESCPISGDDSNLVTVSADDTNTASAGALRYVLRNMTDDTVIARGELLTVADADAV